MDTTIGNSLNSQGNLDIEVPPGLKGVRVTDTEIGDVRGREGFYHYREYSALDLARNRSLEEVWHLLIEGELPSRSQLRAFREEIAQTQAVSGPVRALLPDLARLGQPWSPMSALRSALALLCSADDLRPGLDLDAGERRRDAMMICARVPTLVAALWRLHEGKEPVEPDPRLGHAANYLAMVTGEEPKPEHARAIEQYLIATLDHGFNASTFTARVITSTGADVGAAVIGALGALSGPLHGGSPSRALDTLDAIASPENIDAWVRPRIEAGERMMGFGHAVYRTEDPRSIMLREVAERLGGDRVAFARRVELRILELLAELKPGRELCTNVEFYAGVVMDLCGIPRPMFTPTFAVSRVIGWSANILEQAAEGRIIRPSARYTGPPAPQALPELDAG